MHYWSKALVAVQNARPLDASRTARIASVAAESMRPFDPQQPVTCTSAIFC